MILDLPAVALTVSLTVDGTHFAPGESIHCWLSFYNNSGEDVYLPVRATMGDSLEVIGPDGVALSYGGPWGRIAPGPDSSYRRLGAGTTLVIHANLNELFTFRSAGRYQVRLMHATSDPERAMRASDYELRARTAGVVAVDPGKLVRGPVASDPAAVEIRPTGENVDAYIVAKLSATGDSAAEVVRRNASEITAKYGNTVYGSEAIGLQVERLLSDTRRPERFNESDKLIRVLEEAKPQWQGLAYLLFRASGLAAAQGQQDFTQRWLGKLRARYPHHPSLKSAGGPK